MQVNKGKTNINRIITRTVTAAVGSRYMAFKMRKLLYILLSLNFLVTSCHNSENTENLEKTIEEENILINKNWENSDRDFIRFDSSQIAILFKENPPFVFKFAYVIKVDTITIVNKTLNAFNILSFNDSISKLMIIYQTPDSLKIKAINDGALELFQNYRSLTFYNPKTVDRFSYYIESDSICQKQIDTALNEINSGELVFCIFDHPKFRQKNELIQLLDTYGINYKLIAPFRGMRLKRDCYKETMDYYIEKKYGDNFITILKSRADTLTVLKNRTKIFDSFDCEEKPHIVGKNEASSDELRLIVDLPIKEDSTVFEKSIYEKQYYSVPPFIDIGFIIDTLGNTSHYTMKFYNPQLIYNNQFQAELYKIGVKELKQISKWVPGKVLGIPVMSEHIVRVSFKPKH